MLNINRSRALHSAITFSIHPVYTCMKHNAISHPNCMSSYDDHCGYSCTVYTKIDFKSIQKIYVNHILRINYAIGI